VQILTGILRTSRDRFESVFGMDGLERVGLLWIRQVAVVIMWIELMQQHLRVAS
jgi:hypothetical protein